MSACPHIGYVAGALDEQGLVCKSCGEPLCWQCGRPKDEHHGKCPKVVEFNVPKKRRSA